MADQDLNTVDVEEREKTFAAFIKMVTWSVVVIFVILIFLAITGV